MEPNVSFLDDLAGKGLDSITANEMSTPYLGLVQPDSEAAANGATPGVWRNSATGDEYGNMVNAIVLAFKTIWNEREGQAPFRTVGRYEPHSIPVQTQQPKGGGYPKMINPETGNEVQELYIYALFLPEHPEAGVLMFNPTVSSMTACKQFNTQLKSQILPNGAQAPIFGLRWNMVCDLVDNPQKKGAKMAKFIKAQRDSIISEEMFSEYVKPQLPTIQQNILSITSSVEEAAE